MTFPCSPDCESLFFEIRAELHFEEKGIASGDQVTMADNYLARLAVRAPPEIRYEIHRLRRNLAAATAARDMVRALIEANDQAPIRDGLERLESHLRWLRMGINFASHRDRTAVCDRLPEVRRRRIILSALKAVSSSGLAKGSKWDDPSLENGLVLRDAFRFDYELFLRLSVAVKSGRRSRKAPHDPSTSEGYLQIVRIIGPVPDADAPPSAWCSYAADLLSDPEVLASALPPTKLARAA